MKSLVVLIALSLAVVPASALKRVKHSKAKASDFRPIDNEGFYPLEHDEESDALFEKIPQAVAPQVLPPKASPVGPEELKTSLAPEPEKEVEVILDSIAGVTVSGIPRMIRGVPETEVFFRDVNLSYIVHKDSKHNKFYKAFDEAIRLNQSVSFRADPVSRRVLAVVGVDGVKIPPKNPGTSNPTAGSK